MIDIQGGNLYGVSCPPKKSWIGRSGPKKFPASNLSLALLFKCGFAGHNLSHFLGR